MFLRFKIYSSSLPSHSEARVGLRKGREKIFQKSLLRYLEVAKRFLPLHSRSEARMGIREGFLKIFQKVC
jgi:hypothetical protein